jgi:hypothetical protein
MMNVPNGTDIFPFFCFSSFMEKALIMHVSPTECVLCGLCFWQFVRVQPTEEIDRLLCVRNDACICP